MIFRVHFFYVLALVGAVLLHDRKHILAPSKIIHCSSSFVLVPSNEP
jgi:preprotein translocase subunit SecG